MQLKIYMSSAAALLGFKLGEGQQRGLALPRMAPKRAAAKAKAAALAARVATSNARRDRRREACRALNQLANELGVGHAGLDAKEASGSEVERLIRLLERRVREDGPLERLRGAAKAFADNGGELSAEVVSEEASLSPFVPKHRVLASFFKLKSKAFMLTYNSNDFAVATWAPFRQFSQSIITNLGFVPLLCSLCRQRPTCSCICRSVYLKDCKCARGNRVLEFSSSVLDVFGRIDTENKS